MSRRARRGGSNPVRISYLPGFGPPPLAAPAKSHTRLPFLATIATPRGRYEVEVGEVGMRFVRNLAPSPRETEAAPRIHVQTLAKNGHGGPGDLVRAW
jgi:hypothetical protein